MPLCLHKVMFNRPVVWQINFCSFWINELMKAACIIIKKNNYQSFLLNTVVYSGVYYHDTQKNIGDYDTSIYSQYAVYTVICIVQKCQFSSTYCMYAHFWLTDYFLPSRLWSKAWKCYFFQVDALQRYCQGRTSHVIHLVTNHSHFAQR